MRLICFLLMVQMSTLLFFVSFLGPNIYTQERVYEKDGRWVILLGVSHVAEDSYYQKINNRYENVPNLIVLTEGVKRDPNLSKNSEINVSHTHSAKKMGLVEQGHSFLEHHNNKNVDLFVHELDSAVLGAISSATEFWADGEKTQPLDDIDISLFSFYEEIIIKRNANIKKEILDNKENNILVPWGALHHHDLANFLIKNGYRIKSTSLIKVANVFSVIFALAIGTGDGGLDE